MRDAWPTAFHQAMFVLYLVPENELDQENDHEREPWNRIRPVLMSSLMMPMLFC